MKTMRERHGGPQACGPLRPTRASAGIQESMMVAAANQWQEHAIGSAAQQMARQQGLVGERQNAVHKINQRGLAGSGRPNERHWQRST